MRVLLEVLAFFQPAISGITTSSGKRSSGPQRIHQPPQAQYLKTFRNQEGLIDLKISTPEARFLI